MSVPEVLRQRPQWVGYRIKQRGSPPKPTKIPIDPHTGKSAKTNDPATWAPFDDTCAAVERYKLSGLGFVFSTDDPYCGIDLDHCRDPQTGEIEAWASKIINRLDSYTEVSPSGTGVHIIVQASLSNGRGRKFHQDHVRVEVYDRGRYFCTTGKHIEGTSSILEDRQAELTALLLELGDEPGKSESSVSGERRKLYGEGERYKAMLSFAGKLRHAGCGFEELLAALLAFNSRNCRPPKAETEIRKLAADVARRYKAGKAPIAPRELAVVNGLDIWEKEFKEPVWIVQDLLPQGVHLLVGRPKQGKSYLALQTALVIAKGESLFGTYKTQRGRIAYFDLEGSERLLHKRLHQLSADNTGLPHLDVYWNLSTLTATGAAELDSLLAERPYKLVVIDTLLSVVAGSSPRRDILRGEYSEVAILRDLSRKHNVTFLVVHHTRKADAENPIDAVAGTTGTTAGVDGVLVLRRDTQSSGTLLHVINRETERLDVVLDFDLSKGGWYQIGSAAEVHRSRQRQEIVQVLEIIGPAKPAQVARALGKNQSTTRRLLGMMHTDGEIERTGEGRYLVSSGPKVVSIS